MMILEMYGKSMYNVCDGDVRRSNAFIAGKGFPG